LAAIVQKLVAIAPVKVETFLESAAAIALV
jgi:hypothetical protein